MIVSHEPHQGDIERPRHLINGRPIAMTYFINFLSYSVGSHDNEQTKGNHCKVVILQMVDLLSWFFGPDFAGHHDNKLVMVPWAGSCRTPYGPHLRWCFF